VHLHAERESPKYERAAMKWLRRYLAERSPELSDIAEVVAELMERRGRAVRVSAPERGTRESAAPLTRWIPILPAFLEWPSQRPLFSF
jgi:hypothetical protein